jgi:thioredoxin 1
MPSTITVTGDDFDTVVSSDTATLVDFWADWCGPCHAVAPVLEELAAEHADRLTVAKVNVDDNQALALDYEVMSIPTLVIFKDGVEKKRLVGAHSKEHIEAELAEFIT